MSQEATPCTPLFQHDTHTHSILVSPLQTVLTKQMNMKQ